MSDLRTVKDAMDFCRKKGSLIPLADVDVEHIKSLDAFLRFEKVSSLNHLCLFAYICESHPELDLDWNFFETIRTKRNGIHYYGQKANRDDWVSIDFKMKLYLKTLKGAIAAKLKHG